MWYIVITTLREGGGKYNIIVEEQGEETKDVRICEMSKLTHCFFVPPTKNGR